MPDYHDDVQLYAGDDWTILGTLFDEQGNPLDLTNATFTWVLIDADGQPSPASDAASIEAVEPTAGGRITITVPDTATTASRPAATPTPCACTTVPVSTRPCGPAACSSAPTCSPSPRRRRRRWR